MQELMGRVTALEPSVVQSLKVISYFDALVSGGVNLETLVRGAAALSGAVAGLDTSTGTVRVDASGRRLGAEERPDPKARRSSVDVDGTAQVWLERLGDAHANDDLILERLSLAVASTRAQRRAGTDDTMAVLLDASRPTAERAAAATRLGVGSSPVRAVATTPDQPPSGPSALMATAYGVVRASVVTGSPAIARGGIGHLGPPLALADSWRGALAAYRLTDDRTPVVDADALGVLLDAVLAATEHHSEHPDVVSLRSLDAHTRHVLDGLVHADSVRSAASALHMHHSTLQTRHDAFTRELGYDPRSPVGRSRYEVATMLLRLASV